MKRGLVFIFCALVISAFVLSVLHAMVGDKTSKYSELAQPPSTAPGYTSFLVVCSGLPINPSTVRIATANCLGRIRGFSDAHAITVELAGKAGDSIRLWCVGPTVTDQQLLDDVTAWTTDNSIRVGELIKQYKPVNAASAIMIAALHSTHPCKK